MHDSKTAAEVAELLAAPAMFGVHAICGLLAALAERGAIDPERVLRLLRDVDQRA